jgi:PAS domain S-box-containing protein
MRLKRVSRSKKSSGADSPARRKASAIKEQHFSLVQAAAQIGTWEWDPVTRKSKLSPQLRQMFGIPASDRDPLSAWMARVYPEDLAGMPARFEASNRTGIIECEYRYNHPQKGQRWFYCKGARVQVEGPLFGIVMDITERKWTQDASLRLAAIVQSSDDAIVSKDLNGIVTSWNKGAERMFGYKPEEIIGKPITTIIPPELHPDEAVILSKIRRGEKVDHFETVRLTKCGQTVDVSLTVSPVEDETGRVIGAAKIARDITERKRTQEALLVSEKLASVGRLAATVAHEINNPLAAVVNLVYLLKISPDLPPDLRRYVSMAEKELNRISLLTRQTLGLYRDERGAVPARLGELSRELVAVLSTKAANKSIDLRLDVRSDPEIEAVKSEIRQLVANLLGNSIDAVPRNGSIRVRVSAAGTRSDTQPARGVRLTIGDSGTGIPQEIQPKIFEPFFTTKQDVGTGLGLWICKNIVERHGGSLRLRSSTRPGKSWTVFSICLPAKSVRADLGAGRVHSMR